MAGTEGRDPLQGRTPAGVVEAGDGVDQIAADPGEAGTTDLADGGEGSLAIVDTTEEGEDVRLQALDPKAHPVEAGLEPCRGTPLGGAGGVGLEGDLAARGESKARPHLVEEPTEPVGVDEARRPAADEDGVQLEAAEPGGQSADLGPERLDVLGLPIATGKADEVAVLAAPLAEGDV